MKYLVLLCDGMADTKSEVLGGKTPMELAHKPTIDSMAKYGEVGLCKTVPDGMKPGSDVANLAVMGYDPKEFYTGRSPLEAASIGVKLVPTDVTLRCNLVTLSDEENYCDKTMVDYCADDISSKEAAELIAEIDKTLGTDIYKFYSGVSYRHCLKITNGTTELGNMTPPHDISGKVVGPYLSTHENALPLIELMKKSYNILKDHPVNKKRIENGRRPANSIWLWGEGRKPALANFFDKNGVKGAVVSAVDLLKGIGICADMEVPEVPGATGYIDTNWDGKAQKAIELFKDGYDFVYVHMEAPDECGHRGEAENKVKAIEIIDRLVADPITEYLKNSGEDYRVLVMPDHPTPLDIRTHSGDAVPYMIFDSRKKLDGVDCLTEDTAKQTGNYVEKGYTILSRLLTK